MVIVRHGSGYHTLVAGLETIACTPGQAVMAGEPIGSMGAKNRGNRLYLELRKDNRPIDPGAWFAGNTRMARR